MAVLSIAGIIILVVLFLFLGRVFSVAVKVLFYVLLLSFVGMVFFGVSFSDLWNGLLNGIIWAF